WEHRARSAESEAKGSEGSAPATYRSGAASRSASIRSAAARRTASWPTTPPRTSQSNWSSRSRVYSTDRSRSASTRARSSSAPRAYSGSTATAVPPSALISATALAAPPGQSRIRRFRSSGPRPNMSVYSRRERALTSTSDRTSGAGVGWGLAVTGESPRSAGGLAARAPVVGRARDPTAAVLLEAERPTGSRRACDVIACGRLWHGGADDVARSGSASPTHHYVGQHALTLTARSDTGHRSTAIRGDCGGTPAPG